MKEKDVPHRRIPAWVLNIPHGLVEITTMYLPRSSVVRSARITLKDADAIGYGALANASFWQHLPLEEIRTTMAHP